MGTVGTQQEVAVLDPAEYHMVCLFRQRQNTITVLQFLGKSNPLWTKENPDLRISLSILSPLKKSHSGIPSNIPYPNPFPSK